MNIEISNADFERLQAMAVPFVDTPASVITRLLDAHQPAGSPQHQLAEIVTAKYSLEKLPPLTHTKIMDCSFAKAKPAKQNWDALARLALVEVRKRVASLDDLRRISGAQLREGKFEDQGFKYLDKSGFSYQGVSAEAAIQIIARCARELNAPFRIEFVWRDNPDAYLSGQRGVIEYP